MVMRRRLPLVIAAVLTLAAVGPAAASEPTVQIRIDRFGGYAKDGYGIVRGTATCSTELQGSTVDIELWQKQGKLESVGYEAFGITCDGTEQRWQIGVLSHRVDRSGNYVYRGGPATVRLWAFHHTDFEVVIAQSIVLRGPAQ